MGLHQPNRKTFFMNTRRTFGLAFSTAALALTLAGCGTMSSESMKFKAEMSGDHEVPPVATAAKGTFTASYNKDTSLLLWNMGYEGLGGPAGAAHIHGPAAEGQSAGVLVGFTNPITSPMSGQVTLTPAQVADLMAGKLYVNVHTAAHKGGEIRGQLKAQ
jgi:hypothetical protein